jgi:hypothetical protein
LRGAKRRSNLDVEIATDARGARATIGARTFSAGAQRRSDLDPEPTRRLAAVDTH